MDIYHDSPMRKREYILRIRYGNMHVLHENNKEDSFKYVFEPEHEHLLNLQGIRKIN